MELLLEIVSYHRLSPEQTSTMTVADNVTLGRSKNCDWYLPDPEKVLSGTHAKIERKGNDFFLVDLSTNGLFVNRSVEALGKGNDHMLANDDILSFGDYEVSVALSANKNTASLDVIPSTVPSGVNVNKVIKNTASKMKKAESTVSASVLHDNIDLPKQTIPEEWDLNFGSVEKTAQIELPKTPSKPIKTAKTQPAATTAAPKNKPVSGSDSPIDGFFKGLGLSADVLPSELDPNMMFELGHSLKLLLSGLTESLRERSSLKSEFKINQTTFQSQENNPLKFSASTDDIFQNLYIRRSKSFLSYESAISQAFNDSKKHDIALRAGTFGAVEDILSQLAPATIEQRDFKQSLFDPIVPGHQQQRYWKLYEALHNQLEQELDTRNSSMLSDGFIKAYDKKINSL